MSSSSCGDVSTTKSRSWASARSPTPGSPTGPSSRASPEARVGDSWAAEEGDGPPFPLRRLSRSPAQILRRKAQLEGSQEQVEGGQEQVEGCAEEQVEAPSGKEDEEGDYWLEWGIRLRLFYLEELGSARAAARGLGEIGRLDHQLAVARQGLAIAMEQRRLLEHRLEVVRRDKQELASIMEMHDQAALEELTRLQGMLVEAEGRLEEVAREEGVQVPATAFKRVFTPPRPTRVVLPDLTKPPPALPATPPALPTTPPALGSAPGALTFTSLCALAGQVEELCQGEHGARLVVERLRVGSVGERRQVWRELGLPATLARRLASPTCRPVIHTLMQVDAVAMEQLMEEARQEEAIVVWETRGPGDACSDEIEA